MDIKELRVGDVFIEDNYPTKYEVISLLSNGLIAIDLDDNEEVEFSYNNSAYSSVVYLVN